MTVIDSGESVATNIEMTLDLDASSRDPHASFVGGPQVFISYRTSPDAPLASAMKRLIQSAIEPSPGVFVAGDGGLKPSNAGYKLQIQKAAASARAFVAIITNASLNREWIYFEAGAAWGRDLLYSPVLVGVTPEELPATIADYHAVNIDDADAVERLIRAIAESTGALVKDRFGSRYQSLKRSVQDHINRNHVAAQPDAVADRLFSAYLIGINGEPHRACELLNTYLAEADTDNEKIEIEVYKIDADGKCSDRQKRDKYLLLSEKYPRASYLHYKIALVEAALPRKLESYANAVNCMDDPYSSLARVRIAELNATMGEWHSAYLDMLALMRTKHSTYFAERAAIAAIEVNKSLSPQERLLLFLAGMASPDEEILTKIAQYSADAEFNGLRLFAASRALSFASTAANHNTLGRARTKCDLFALAYEAYSAATKLGLHVSMVNSASIVLSRGNAYAALEVLASREGPSDAADPSFPYKVRSQIESALKSERDQENEILSRSEILFNAIWILLREQVVSDVGNIKSVSGRLQLGNLTISVDGGTPSIFDTNYSLTRVLHDFPAVYLVRKVLFGPDELSLLCVTSMHARAFHCDNFAMATGFAWYTWLPRDFHRLALETDPNQ